MAEPVSMFPDRFPAKPPKARRRPRTTLPCCEEERTKAWATLHVLSHQRTAFSEAQLSERAGVPQWSAAQMCERALTMGWLAVPDLTGCKPKDGVGRLWIGALAK